MIKTRQITDGAMLIAITGALIMMDRFASMFFEDAILLLVPVSIIIHSNKYGLKSGVYLSVAFLFLMLIGNITTILYIPLGIIVGLSVSAFEYKDYKKLFRTMLIPFAIGEVIITLFIYPLLGISLQEQMGNRTGKYALSSFLFMIQVVAYLETWLTIKLSNKLSKHLLIGKTVDESILKIEITKRDWTIKIIALLIFPIFIYMETGRIYLITFSLWAFEIIGLICYICIWRLQTLINTEIKER